MNENERNITDRDLDEALKLMAEEVPPMPADFHDKWVNAVRKDAEEAKAEPVPAEKAPGRLAYINRFNRILSVAAVFVFLIGGVMLYRASRKEAAMVQDRKQRRHQPRLKRQKRRTSFRSMKQPVLPHRRRLRAPRYPSPKRRTWRPA